MPIGGNTPATVSFVTPPSYARTHAYLTIGEFRDAPTAVDTSNLIIGGTQLSEDQMLQSIIFRASSWVDEYCGQVLAATAATETGRVRVNRHGEFIVHPSQWPILEVTDFQVGPTAGLFQSVDLSAIWIDRALFAVPSGYTGASSAGPLQFGIAPYGRQLIGRWSYTAGWPVTELRVTANAGDTTITVGDRTGVYGGTILEIYDNIAGNESAVVAATPTTNTITIGAPLAITHTVTGTAYLPATSLPPAVKQAAIMITACLIRTRGNEALVMDSVHGPNKVKKTGNTFDANLDIAKELLNPYRTTRGA